MSPEVTSSTVIQRVTKNKVSGDSSSLSLKGLSNYSIYALWAFEERMHVLLIS